MEAYYADICRRVVANWSNVLMFQNGGAGTKTSILSRESEKDI